MAAMNALPRLYLARHGETSWSVTGQHTGRTDLPLTKSGEEQARRLGARLGGRSFTQVRTSPLARATLTCQLAGYAGLAKPDDDLLEWDYGAYEGRRTTEIHVERPGWELFRDGCPGGERPADVAARADRVVARVRAAGGDVLVFSSGHFLRALAARWLGVPVACAKHFLLGTTGFGALGYEHSLDQPAVELWNDTSHLAK
jgi:probable phosphoglycerate mutase